MTRARFLVRGTVQGVGYRWFVRGVAERLGLVGVARNLADGSVEVLAEGSAPALVELEAALRKGPRMAGVESVEKTELPHEVQLPNSFETR